MRHHRRCRTSRLVAVVALLPAVLIAAAAAPASTSRARSCATIVFTPNSGDGLFDIKARSISCDAARRKLRHARGNPRRLTGWTCDAVRYDDVTGSRRYHCTNRIPVRGAQVTRLIAYTTGN